MWIYIIIFIILIYCIIIERKYLQYQTIESNNKQLSILGSNPSNSQTTSELLDDIQNASHASQRIVVWRPAFIVSFIIITIVWYIIYQQFPNELSLLVFMVVSTLIIYFAIGFYQYHFGNYIQNYIQQAVNILQSRL